MEKLRIGVLISGTGTNMNAIIKACEEGRINGEVVIVGSDNLEAKGLETAKQKGIQTFLVDFKTLPVGFDGTVVEMQKLQLPHDFDFFKVLQKSGALIRNKSTEEMIKFLCSRAMAEAKLFGELNNKVDLLVLAGYMKMLTAYFIDRFNSNPSMPRIINIHPALLPAFPGVDGYGDTFRYGCKVGGCTVHFVDYGEDTGPIIGQRSYSINPGDTLEDVKKRGLELEWQLYPECIQLFAEGRLKVAEKEGRKIVEIK